MNTFAKIENEAVVGYLHNLAEGTYNIEKVRPVVEDRPPDYNSAIHNLSAKQEIVEPTRVVWRYIKTDKALSVVKDDLESRVDTQAGELRRQFTTDAMGQSENYTEKRFEATQVKDDASPTIEDYPTLAASIGTDVQDTQNTVTDLKAAGALVETRAKEWATRNNPVETVRRKGKLDIRNANNVNEAWAVYNSIQWPPEVQSRRKVGPSQP